MTNLQGRILSALDLVQYRSKVEKILPSQGKKDFKPSGSWLESKQIQSALYERKDLLQEERVEKIGTLIEAEWDEGLLKAHITRRAGKHLDTFGHEVRRELYFYPEEALFLLENNHLELLYGGVAMSIQQGYFTLLSPHTDCSLDEYRVYSQLMRQGYRMLRHTFRHRITRYERMLGLHHYTHPSKEKKPKKDSRAFVHDTEPTNDDEVNVEENSNVESRDIKAERLSSTVKEENEQENVIKNESQEMIVDVEEEIEVMDVHDDANESTSNERKNGDGPHSTQSNVQRIGNERQLHGTADFKTEVVDVEDDEDFVSKQPVPDRRREDREHFIQAEIPRVDSRDYGQPHGAAGFKPEIVDVEDDEDFVNNQSAADRRRIRRERLRRNRRHSTATNVQRIDISGEIVPNSSKPEIVNVDEDEDCVTVISSSVPDRIHSNDSDRNNLPVSSTNSVCRSRQVCDSSFGDGLYESSKATSSLQRQTGNIQVITIDSTSEISIPSQTSSSASVCRIRWHSKPKMLSDVSNNSQKYSSSGVSKKEGDSSESNVSITVKEEEVSNNDVVEVEQGESSSDEAVQVKQEVASNSEVIQAKLGNTSSNEAVQVKQEEASNSEVIQGNTSSNKAVQVKQEEASNSEVIQGNTSSNEAVQVKQEVASSEEIVEVKQEGSISVKEEEQSSTILAVEGTVKKEVSDSTTSQVKEEEINPPGNESPPIEVFDIPDNDICSRNENIKSKVTRVAHKEKIAKKARLENDQSFELLDITDDDSQRARERDVSDVEVVDVSDDDNDSSVEKEDNSSSIVEVTDDSSSMDTRDEDVKSVIVSPAPVGVKREFHPPTVSYVPSHNNFQPETSDFICLKSDPEFKCEYQDEDHYERQVKRPHSSDDEQDVIDLSDDDDDQAGQGEEQTATIDCELSRFYEALQEMDREEERRELTENRYTILDNFPNAYGLTAMHLSVPPARLLPKNVCPNKSHYIIPVEKRISPPPCQNRFHFNSRNRFRGQHDRRRNRPRHFPHRNAERQGVNATNTEWQGHGETLTNSQHQRGFEQPGGNERFRCGSNETHQGRSFEHRGVNGTNSEQLRHFERGRSFQTRLDYQVPFGNDRTNVMYTQMNVSNLITSVPVQYRQQLLNMNVPQVGGLLPTPMHIQNMPAGLHQPNTNCALPQLQQSAFDMSLSRGHLFGGNQNSLMDTDERRLPAPQLPITNFNPGLGFLPNFRRTFQHQDSRPRKPFLNRRGRPRFRSHRRFPSPYKSRTFMEERSHVSANENVVTSTAVDSSPPHASPEISDDEEDDEEVDPLVKPSDCTDVENILKNLQIIKCTKFENIALSESSPLVVRYDLYLPDTVFRKSNPSLPDFRLVILRSEQAFPSPGKMAALQQEYHDDVGLLLAVVTPDTISFFQYSAVSLPVEDYSSLNG